jgi:hypothetical protein
VVVGIVAVVAPPVSPVGVPPVSPVGVPPAGAAADCAMAGEFIVVESSIVIAGGTTTANLPAEVKKARRSVPSFDRVSCGSIFIVSIDEVVCRTPPPTGRYVTVEKNTGSATF